jgi:GntR family transcriptional regulator
MSNNLPESLADAIDKEVPIPYHYQLRELLRGEIVAGRWSVDEKLPSERELCEAFGLSRTTIREAIDALVNEGLLRREKGRGTFIAAPKILESLLQSPTGFTDSMNEQDLPVCTRVLRMEVGVAPDLIARELRVTMDEPLIILDRLRFIFDEPILLVTSYLPQRLCPSLVNDDLTHNSLYHLLRNKYGFTIARAKRCMEAVAANEMEAKLLQINSGAPLMLIESIVYTEEGTPLEYFKARHRGDRTKFLVESYTPVMPENNHRGKR